MQSIYTFSFHQLSGSRITEYPKAKGLVSGNAGDEKNLHPGGLKFIFRFSRDILFSSSFSLLFCVLVLFFLLVCFLTLSICILIHIWLCGWMSDKKFFPRSISRNKTTFFWPNNIILHVSKERHVYKSYFRVANPTNIWLFYIFSERRSTF